MRKYYKYAILICIVGVLLIVTGVTYSFFNYTRTGTINTLGTGNIYFSSEQGDSLNITNMFPISSNEANNIDLDTIILDIKGNTTYVNGEEFVVSIVDVNTASKSKHVPITYLASYEPAENKTIGSDSNDYWNDRNNKDSNIYLLNETGSVREGKQVLVGYVDNEGNGIEGTLTIKAFIDDSKMVISDTYPNDMKYELVPNLTTAQVNTCANYMHNNKISFVPIWQYQDFCRGEDHYIYGIDFQGCLRFYSSFFNESDLSFLLENGIITGVENGTTAEWTEGRDVFTTEEWNTFNNNPLNFKIKVESNEGIWVENPSNAVIDTCPGCKYLYSLDFFYTTWNTRNEDPTVFNTGLSDSYYDVIDQSNRDYFIGVKVNENNQVTDAYSCGIKNGYPFCLKGYLDDTYFDYNMEIIESPEIWDDSCEKDERTYHNTSCGPYNNTTLSLLFNDTGYTSVGFESYNTYCFVSAFGMFGCYKKLE